MSKFAPKTVGMIGINKFIDPQYNYALSQVFSPSLLKNINNSQHENNIRKLLLNCGLYSKSEKWDFVEGLGIIYNYLKENYRCEYVYKNEIAIQLLLKFHSDNSATLLKEVSSDGSIADIVIINGNTVAYEIKTELDSFDRLPTQIDSYEALYDFLYIVTHPDAIDRLVKKIDATVGIIILEKNHTLRIEREAAPLTHKFTPAKAVLTLRQSELVHAYEKYVGSLPKMGTALIYEFCYHWFMTLQKTDAHIIFNEALKSRKPSPYQFNLIRNCHPSLKMLFLGRELSNRYCASTCDKIGIFI